VAFIRRGSTRSLTKWGSSITAIHASRARHKQLVDDLRDARDELELRVAKRTADLHDSNARLAEALAERTALEQARSEWLLKLINAQEDERRRIARELHDEMGQQLCVLRIGLNELKASDPDRAVRLQDQVEEIERSVHRLARDLRPAALDDLGLVTALGMCVEEWVTGYSHEYDRVGTRDAGFDTHSVRPIDPIGLTTTLKRAGRVVRHRPGKRWLLRIGLAVLWT